MLSSETLYVADLNPDFLVRPTGFGRKSDREVLPQLTYLPTAAFARTGATGGQDLSQAVKELAAMPRGSKAIASICADGGEGAVAPLENG